MVWVAVATQRFRSRNSDCWVRFGRWILAGPEQLWRPMGEDGYFRLQFGSNACGITNEATVVEVEEL